MSSDGKSTLTTLSKREEIVNTILELLFIKEKLTNRDAEYHCYLLKNLKKTDPEVII